jgi:hypothetical protein
MASAILSQFTAPAIDGQAVRRVLAPVIMENIVQDIILRDGYGVTEKFSTDTDAFEIRVVRQRALDLDARKFGATFNGGFFNSLTEIQPTSQEYGIRLDHIIDRNVDIPSNMQDMFPLDVVGATTQRVGQAVARNVNASTLAEQLRVSLNYNATVSVREAGLINDAAFKAASVGFSSSGETFDYNPALDTKSIIFHTDGTSDWQDTYLSASALLDNGDERNGVDIFPVDMRVAVWRPEIRAELLKTGQIIIGGSNFAQQMIAAGKVSPDGRPRENMGGYFGDIDATPQHIASKAIWNLAEKYLGLTTGALDNIYGLIVSSMGTGRALAFNNTIKTIDSPNGQGMRIQPKYRWGVETWFPKSVVLIASDQFGNPAWTGSAIVPLTILQPQSVAPQL